MMQGNGPQAHRPLNMPPMNPQMQRQLAAMPPEQRNKFLAHFRERMQEQQQREQMQPPQNAALNKPNPQPNQSMGARGPQAAAQQSNMQNMQRPQGQPGGQNQGTGQGQQTSQGPPGPQQGQRPPMPPLHNIPPLNPQIIQMMDQREFPRNMLSSHFRNYQLPPHVKSWGQLKQHVSANPQGMPNDILKKLRDLQALQYYTMVRNAQATREQQRNNAPGAQQPTGPQQPQQTGKAPQQAQGPQQMQQGGQGTPLNSAANQNNAAQPKQPNQGPTTNMAQNGAQATQFAPGAPIPSNFPRPAPHEIHTWRQRGGAQMAGFTDEQLSELIRRKKWEAIRKQWQEAQMQKTGQGQVPTTPNQQFPGQFGGVQFNQPPPPQQQQQPPPPPPQQQQQPQQQTGPHNSIQHPNTNQQNQQINQATQGPGKGGKRTPNDPSAPTPTMMQQPKRASMAAKPNEPQAGQTISNVGQTAGPPNAQAQNTAMRNINRFGPVDSAKRARLIQIRGEIYRAPLRHFTGQVDPNMKAKMREILQKEAPMMYRAENIPNTLFCQVDDNEDIARKLISAVSRIEHKCRDTC
jgi:hypothetical protein